jgi:glyoxylase I family protein
MERVTGIGGLFFRARDPAALALWYEEHLGVVRTPRSYDAQAREQEAGPTAFEPFPEATKFLGDASRRWMVNFRVRDLDAMVRQLRVAGISVEVDPTVCANGKFAQLADPEGNQIQLWQPEVPASGSAAPP